MRARAFARTFARSSKAILRAASIYKDVSNGIFPAGIEYYLPLFFDDTAILTDYLPPDASSSLQGDMQSAIDAFWRDTRSRYELLRGDRDRPLLPPQELFLFPDQLFGAIKPFSRITLFTQTEADDANPLAVRPLPLAAGRSPRRQSAAQLPCVLHAVSRARAADGGNAWPARNDARLTSTNTVCSRRNARALRRSAPAPRS